MFKLLITKFWPVLIPVILYLIWYLIKKSKKENDKNLVLFVDGPVKLVFYSTTVILVFCFVYMFINLERKEETYIPSRVENGKIIPSSVK